MITVKLVIKNTLPVCRNWRGTQQPSPGVVLLMQGLAHYYPSRKQQPRPGDKTHVGMGRLWVSRVGRKY